MHEYTLYDIILSMEMPPHEVSGDNPDAIYDEQLDRLVDSGLWSYDDARRQLGPAPYDQATDDAPTIAESGNVAGVSVVPHHSPNTLSYGDGRHIGDDGEIEYFKPPTILSPEQHAINRRGMDRVQAVLANIAVRNKR